MAWWVDGEPDRVWLAERQPGQALWAVPIPVSGLDESARRPSVVVHEGAVIVTYERTSPLDDTLAEVVMARADTNGDFTRAVLATTSSAGRLDPMLHSRPGRLWVDWKNGAGEFGYAIASPSLVLEGTSTVPWTDPTWIGAEQVRLRIESLLAADGPPD